MRRSKRLASSRGWPDLPSDQLEDISGRLHAAGDYVRFRATCKPWRDSVPPPEGRPAFLPWLLAPPGVDANTGRRKARCIFSSPGDPSIAAEIPDQGRTWVIRAEDGVAYWLVGDESNTVLVDPLTGSNVATLPPFPDEIAEWFSRADAAAGAIPGDGTILIYGFCQPALDSHVPYYLRDHRTFNLALLRHGDGTAVWTPVQNKLYVHPSSWHMESCSVAYNNGWIIVCNKRRFQRIMPAQPPEQRTALSERWLCWSMQDHERFHSNYLVESRGELLLACVEFDDSCWKSRDCNCDIIGLPKALSVSVHGLQDEEQGVNRTTQWVRSDGARILADRVLFLGRPSSFAMEAARIGMDGGCAYFFDKRWLNYQGNMGRGRCRLLKYSFRDGRSEFVEEQPSEWTGIAGMWITPQPAIKLPHHL